MKTYNFEKFTNGRGVEMLTVFSPGKVPTTTEETLSIPRHEQAKKLFSMEVEEITSLTKEEIFSDYITGEASIRGEEAENLYNQIISFK